MNAPTPKDVKMPAPLECRKRWACLRDVAPLVNRLASSHDAGPSFCLPPVRHSHAVHLR